MNDSEKIPTFAKGVTLRVLRSTFNISQKQIAPILNKSQPSYSRMENEEKELSSEELEKILKALKNEGNLVIVGSHFTQTNNVDPNQEEKYKAIEEENIGLKSENSELKNEIKSLHEKYIEKIERLFGMLEVKHQSMVA
jgi:transcriptional regulator with XRE-family HTH domain